MRQHSLVYYIVDGHCMRAQADGHVSEMRSRVQHDDRKSLSRWLASQARYADQEAELLMSKSQGELRIQDRLRRMMVITPWLVPMYCPTVGRGISDGWAGFIMRCSEVWRRPCLH